MFYHYSQNNSGGRFNGPTDIIVEAEDAELADFLAQRHGVYFDGIDSGIDCGCCGDRWTRAYEKGTKEPEIYGVPVEKYKPHTLWTGERSSCNECRIVSIDGSVKVIKYTEAYDFNANG